MSSWSASARYSPEARAAAAFVLAAMPLFSIFCIRCVDSLPDIPPRSAAPRRVPHRTHRPGKAPHWGPSAQGRNPEIPAGIVPAYYTAASGWRWSASRRCLPSSRPVRRAGLPAPFWRADSGPFCQSSGAGRSPRPAPAWCPGPRPSSAGRHSPPALWRVSVVHSSLMPRRAALPCRRCRPSRCRRSSSGGHGSARRPSSTSARSARWSGTPE